jgi:hypothetical protein
VALLVALFIVVPIVEIWAIIEIGSLIGVWPTVALLIADAVLGSLLLRHQGRGAWRRFNQALTERRFPGREVADGPPSRAIVRGLMRGYVTRRFLIVGMPGRSSEPGPGRSRREYDYESTAEEVDVDDPRLPGA